MSAIAQASGLSPAQSWNWSVLDPLSDIRIRYGIKLGLAGLLALFLTQILPLPHDAWAILTVFVMMLSQYVGSAAIKAITRVIGTVAGAILGVWLVGNYTSTPIIFLPVLFVVMAHASYKLGQYGPRQAPYSYFVLGVTTLVIVTNGIAAPDQVWQLGLYRAEEILVGVVSALLVSTILWPRYAREEFITAARDALWSLKILVSPQTEKDGRGGEANAALNEIRETFAARLVALSNLRQAGARESSFFSAQLPHYDAYLASLVSVFDWALYLRERSLADAPIVEPLRRELEQVYRGLGEEIRILSSPGPPGERLSPSSLTAAFADLEQKVGELRDQGFLVDQPIATDVAVGSLFGALRSLRDELKTLRDIRERLLGHPQSLPEPKRLRDRRPTIDWFWVKIGIKGGLSAVIAVTLLMWIHPPGPAFIPLTAWLQVVTSRPSLRVGGAGDLRALQKAFLGCLVLAGCTVVLLAVTPLLANYLAMNLALFFVLVGFGFATAKIPGITFGMQLAFLIISAFVGLNPQQPVSSQTIIDTFLGIGIGLFIGAAVGRFIWPGLPQTILRENLLNILADVRGLLSGGRHREASRTSLLLWSVESYQAVGKIRLSGDRRSNEERERLYAMTMELVTLVPRVHHFTALREDLPQATEPFLRLPLQRLNTEFIQLLDAFANCLKAGSARRDLPTLDGALAETDEALQQIRDRRILASCPIEEALLTLDIVARYRAVADALNKLRSLIADPQIHRYWGDYAL